MPKMDALVTVLSVLLPVTVLGQQCSILQASELGNTTAPVNTGLLATVLALSGGGGDGSVTVQLQDFNIVCLAQGDTMGTYRSISLIASYNNEAGVDDTTQLDLQCVSGSWSSSTQASATDPSTGNLETPLRIDCFACLAPGQGIAVSDAEHCVACNTTCTRCTGASLDDQTCCNFFDMSGSCVTECPADSTPNAESACMCDAGFLTSGSSCVNDVCDPNPCGNGTCMRMSDTFSCTCDMGFELSGNTCVESSSVCEPNPCGNGTCMEMGDGFSCVCGTGFEFTDGTCVAFDPVNSACEPNPCQNGGTCTTTVERVATCLCPVSADGPFCSECNDGFSLSSGRCTPSCSVVTTAVVASVITAIITALLATVIFMLLQIALCKYHPKFKRRGVDSGQAMYEQVDLYQGMTEYGGGVVLNQNEAYGIAVKN